MELQMEGIRVGSKTVHFYGNLNVDWFYFAKFSLNLLYSGDITLEYKFCGVVPFITITSIYVHLIKKKKSSSPESSDYHPVTLPCIQFKILSFHLSPRIFFLSALFSALEVNELTINFSKSPVSCFLSLGYMCILSWWYLIYAIL